MSDPITMRYKREPMMLWYSLWFTTSPFLSESSKVVVLIGVDIGLNSSILIFFIMSFMYFA
jgi:hypothetical protein